MAIFARAVGLTAALATLLLGATAAKPPELPVKTETRCQVPRSDAVTGQPQPEPPAPDPGLVRVLEGVRSELARRDASTLRPVEVSGEEAQEPSAWIGLLWAVHSWTGVELDLSPGRLRLRSPWLDVEWDF